jgi:hypothetical protein
MARARFANEKRIDRQTRPKRRFDKTNSFDAHNSVIAAVPRENRAESLEPTVLTARNHSDISFDGLSRS